MISSLGKVLGGLFCLDRGMGKDTCENLIKSGYTIVSWCFLGQYNRRWLTIYCFIAVLCLSCGTLYLEPLGFIGFY